MLKEEIKNGIGNLLIDLLPERAARLAERGMTIADRRTFTKVDYLLRNALLRKAEKNQNFEVLAKFHHNYWTNQGSSFFSQKENGFADFFHSECTFLFDALEIQLAQTSPQFKTLVEIGTGDGQVLNYLSSKFPAINHLIGIDLSTEQIAINSKQFEKNTKLEFIASDGFDWVKANGQKFTVFVTSGGVLEYFTQLRLQEFLTEVKSIGKVIFVAIEPKGRDHDFIKHPNSQPYGHERSFSHNYQKMFKDAGFEIWHSSEKEYSKNDKINFSFTGASCLS